MQWTSYFDLLMLSVLSVFWVYCYRYLGHSVGLRPFDLTNSSLIKQSWALLSNRDWDFETADTHFHLNVDSELYWYFYFSLSFFLVACL